MVPCTIEFFRKKPYNLPCAWLPSEYRYVVCALCVEGIEIRCCDGATKLRYKICPEHRPAVDAGTTYDQDFLVWIRESLKDGTLTRPADVIQPKLAATLNDFAAHIERVKETEDSRIRSPQIKEGDDRHIYIPEPKETELFQQNPTEYLWPKNLVQIYSHAEDCNYGYHPSFIVAPTRAITTLERQMVEEHERLYWYGCEFCVREAPLQPLHMSKEMDWMVKRESASGEPLDHAHCSECLSTLNRIAREACYVPNGLKTIFFKRCNNEYLNAMGYRLESTCRSSSEAAKHLSRNSDFTYTALKAREEMVSVGSIDDENLVRYAWWRNQEYNRKKAANEQIQCESQRRKEVAEKKANFKIRVRGRAEAILDLTEQGLKRLELGVSSEKKPVVAQQRWDSVIEFD